MQNPQHELTALLQRIVNDRKAWREDKIGTTDYELAMRHNIDDAERLLANMGEK